MIVPACTASGPVAPAIQTGKQTDGGIADGEAPAGDVRHGNDAS